MSGFEGPPPRGWRSKGRSWREANFRCSEGGGRDRCMGLVGEGSEAVSRVLMRVRAARAWSLSKELLRDNGALYDAMFL